MKRRVLALHVSVIGEGGRGMMGGLERGVFHTRGGGAEGTGGRTGRRGKL